VKMIIRLLVTVVVCLIGGLFLTLIVTVGIWPGEVKLVAPIFCSDAQPDAFVVTDTSSTGDGETMTEFTLYCVGPRGDATDVGWAKPFMLLILIHASILFVLVLLVRGVNALRRAGDGDEGPSDGLTPDGDISADQLSGSGYQGPIIS
jgi:hypothetical protein